MPQQGPHISSSPWELGEGRRATLARGRGKGLKAQPMACRWTSGAGAYAPASLEVMKVRAVSRKPMNRPEGALAL